MRKWASIWVMCGLSLLACQEKDFPRIEKPGSEYLSLRVGAYQIYQVDSAHTLLNIATRYEFQLKQVVTDSFRNEEGGTTYVLSRFKRINSSAPWTPMPTWQARVNDREAIVTEGNTPFVKLTFPILGNATWNGNAYNSIEGNDNCGDGQRFSCDIYKNEWISGDYPTANGLSFQDVVKVEEENSPDLITESDIRYSVYAKGVGLIERQVEYILYCSKNDCLGQGKVDKGWKYRWMLIEYGK